MSSMQYAQHKKILNKLMIIKQNKEKALHELRRKWCKQWQCFAVNNEENVFDTSQTKVHI